MSFFQPQRCFHFFHYSYQSTLRNPVLPHHMPRYCLYSPLPIRHPSPLPFATSFFTSPPPSLPRWLSQTHAVFTPICWTTFSFCFLLMRLSGGETADRDTVRCTCSWTALTQVHLLTDCTCSGALVHWLHLLRCTCSLTSLAEVHLFTDCTCSGALVHWMHLPRCTCSLTSLAEVHLCTDCTCSGAIVYVHLFLLRLFTGTCSLVSIRCTCIAIFFACITFHVLSLTYAISVAFLYYFPFVVFVSVV